MEEEQTNKYMEMVEGYLGIVSEEGSKLSELAETFLWKKPLENMLSAFHYDHLKLPRYQGLLLSGEPGNGRHTLADAYIQSVCGIEMCFEKAVFIRLRAEDFNEKQLTSVEDISCFVSALFDTCGMTGQHSFIIFDQMEYYNELALVCNCIADAFPGVETNKIHVICIVNKEKKIPVELSRKLLHIRCTNPDENLRKTYFEKNLSYTVEDWVYGTGKRRKITLDLADTTIDELVSMTEGFSFGMLEELVQVLKMNVSGQTLGDEPECKLHISNQTVTQYVHMFSTELPICQTQPQVIYMNVPAAGTMGNTPEKSVYNPTIEELGKKGEERTFSEDMKLIKLVPPEKK